MRPAFVVPDELSWTIWGQDPRRLGLVPAAVEDAQVVLAPRRVPQELRDAVREAWGRAPGEVQVQELTAPLSVGVALADVLDEQADGHAHAGREGHDVGDAHDGQEVHDQDAGHVDPHAGHEEHHAHTGHEEHHAHAGHGEHGAHAGHGGHDHHAMMAIVGDPSVDGLVMEPVRFELGPLSGPLPGGLVVAVELDGDVVERCEVRATLQAPDTGDRSVPDPLTPVAWSTAILVAREQVTGAAAPPVAQWSRLASVEVERVTSHLAWLRGIGRLLGWAELVDRAQDALVPVLDFREAWGVQLAPADRPPDGRSDLVGARRAVDRLASLLHGRRLAARAHGRGLTDPDAVLHGPNRRAAGTVGDARAADPLYDALGFVAAEQRAGDALARILVRVDEVRESLRLVIEALDRARAADDQARGHGAFVTPDGALVEGPRGPVTVRWATLTSALGPAGSDASGTLRAAARASIGQEWAGALLTLASFDLSPWRVGP